MTRPTLPRKTLYRRFYPRITARVTLPFLLTVVLIAGVGVFIVTRLVAGSIQERLNNQLVDSALAASNALVEIEDQQIATLRLMAFTEGVAEALMARDAGTLDGLLRPLAANARVDALLAYDAGGHVVYQLKRLVGGAGLAYDNTVRRADIQGWPSARSVLTASEDQLGDKFAEIVQDETDALMVISAPVIDTGAGGVLVGGLSLGLTMENLTLRISQQALSEVILYGSGGQVLGSAFRLVAAEELRLTPGRASELFALVQGGAHPIEENTIGGLGYQVLYVPLELRSQPVGVMAVALPSDFIAERIGVSRDTFALLFAGLFALVALFGLLVTRSIIRPIRRLVDTTRAIRAGDLSRRVGLGSPDEFGELGTSFDHMTDQLVARSREISRLYEAQVEETARREAVLTSITDAVIVMNPAGRTILHNHAAEGLLKQVQADPPAYRQFVALVQNPASLAEPRTVELAGGYYDTHATPVHMPSGELLGYVVVFHDITSMVEVERVKDEMILQLSHELRTPLTAARGYVEMVQMVGQPQLNEQSSGFIGSAVEHLSTLERMVNQVIDVSAMLSGKFAVEFEEMILSDVLAEAIERVYPQIEGRGLKLWTQITASVDLAIDGDPVRLGQVFEHVLRNAASYTLPGGWIEVKARTEGGHAMVTVADNGVGIDEDELDRVFERMYRGRSAEAGPTDSRGLGLGLYLARQIVEAHHGTITLESEPNLGTTVTIRIPTRQRVQP